MRSVVRLIGVLLALSVLVGCNVYHLKDRQYRGRFERVGVVDHTASLPAGQVHYWAGGEGRPVLLLHGFGGHAVWQWYSQVGPLTDIGARVIAPDIGWFGQTIPNGDSFTVESQAEMFFQLMDRLEIDRFDVVGMSYGGFVARRMATLHPERVERLVLADSPGPGFGQQDYEQVLRRLGVGSMIELLVPREPADIRRLLRLSLEHPPRVPGFALKDIYEAEYARHVDERTRLLDELRPFFESGGGGYPTQPTLLLWGERDRFFPLELGMRLRDAIGEEARLVVIADAGHASNLDRPADFSRHLIEFLARP